MDDDSLPLSMADRTAGVAAGGGRVNGPFGGKCDAYELMIDSPSRWQASLLVADATVSFEITGLGDVLEPKDGVIAIGSGGTFALGACNLTW
jgi:hypothetical protein